MTDITSKNNYYYSAFQYNSSPNPVQAQVDESLLYPLLETSSDYQVAISKAEIDLSTIPLTQYNIPLKAFQVGLRDGTNVQTAYVRQLNGSSLNYIYDISATGVISKYSYVTTPTPSITYVSGVNLSLFFKTIGAFFVDDYENYYVLGSQLQNATIFNTFSAFTPQGDVLQTLSFPSITCATIDLRQNVYLGVDNGSSSEVQIYSNVNGIETVDLTQTGSLTQDKNSNPLHAIETVCVDGQILVGYNQNQVTSYNADTLVAQSTYTNTDVTTFGRASSILTSSDRFVMTNRGSSTLLFGQALTSSSVVNMTTDASFVAGTWDQNTQMCITNWQAGFGVAGSEIYTFSYDPSTGICGSPTPFINTPAVLNCSNGVLASDLTATNSNILYYLTPRSFGDGQTSTTVLEPVTSEFRISGSTSISSYSYQASTGDVIALGSDLNLYKSSIPLYPRMFVVNNSTTETTAYMPASVVNFPAKTAVSGTVIPSLIPNVTGQTVQASYIEGAYMYVCSTYSASGIGYAQLYKYDYPAGTLVGTSGSFTAYNVVDITMCQTNFTGISAIAFQDFTVGMILMLVDMSTFIPSVSVNISSTALTEKISLCSSLTTSEGYNGLAVSNGTIVYVYSVPDSSTLTAGWFGPLTNFNSPTVQGLFFSQIVGANVAQTFLSTLGSGNQITTVNFVGEFASVANWSPYTLPTEIGSFPANPVGTAGIRPFTSSGFQEGYFQTTTGGSAINLTTISLSAGIPNYITYQTTLPSGTTSVFLAPSLDSLFSFDSITASGVSSPNYITGVSVDSVHPSLVYCCDNTGIVYSGYLSGSSIAFSAVTNPTINGTYQTVNSIPLPTSIVSAEAFDYSLSSQSLVGTFIPPTGNVINSISRNNISDEFVLNYGITTLSLPPATLSPSITIPVPNAYITWTKNGQDISAGNVPIMTMSVLIDAINTAYLECYAKFTSGSFTECPFLTLDYNTGLLTFNYAVDLSSVPATKFILMNPYLIQYCKFPNKVDSVYPYLNDISPIPLNSTTLTQTSKSLYLFNQLDKIVFISNTIYVFGSFFGNNNTNNIITDIDVPINSAGYVDNVGQTLYYQPSFLRPYILSSSNALQRVQLYVNYVYKDGTQYPLIIASGTNWNCKLIFPRRF